MIKATNPENVRDTIRILEEVNTIYMPRWQDTEDPTKLARDMSSAIECGTACCLGGWIALSERFIEFGGHQSQGGAPVIQIDELNKLYGHDAIAEYFGIPKEYARKLAAVGTLSNSDTVQELKDTYGVTNAKDIKIEKVIERLKELLP